MPGVGHRSGHARHRAAACDSRGWRDVGHQRSHRCKQDHPRAGVEAIELDGVKVSDGYHNLSHHGKADEKLAQLKVLDEWHMKLLAGLFTGLKDVTEDGDSLYSAALSPSQRAVGCSLKVWQVICVGTRVFGL